MSVTTGDDHVTIRMYNVGFGDAFLIVFPGEQRPLKVLVDCGTHSSGSVRPIAEVVGEIIADVTDDDGVARIDVVVGTHRHQDHVSGFARKEWARVEVGEVWMPWTEHPTDAEARRIREKQSTSARHLCMALQALGADEGLIALAQNNLTNARAMETLHRGFAGAPMRRFLPGEQGVDHAGALLPGVRVHVLGPSRDPEVIRDMDPPAGETYLRVVEGLETGSSHPPFPPQWALGPEDFAQAEDHAHLVLDERVRDRVKEVSGVDAFALAVSLEKAVNGTSLMLMFEVGEAYLLFPGDAQWGTWRRALDDPDAKSLLERTTFLKVGHHGSHNATPRDFVDELRAAREGDGAASRELWAMVSTHPVEQWKEIPKPELLAALGEVTPRLASSDAGAGPSVEGFSHWSHAVIEAHVPIG